MIRSLLLDLLLFAPAYAGNAAPVIAGRIPGLSAWRVPVWADIFGRNKTWRGLVTGIAGGVIAAMILWLLGMPPGKGVLPAPSLSFLSSVELGALLGMAAIIGDMAESAIKRSIGIPPGGALPFWDGADHIIGAMLFLAPLYVPSLTSIMFLLLLSPVLSLLANIGAFWLGWKDKWY